VVAEFFDTLLGSGVQRYCSFLVSLFCVFASLAAAGEPAALKRTPWSTSQLEGTPEPPALYRMSRVFPELKFERPVDMCLAPIGDTLFIVEQGGRILQLPNDMAASEPKVVFDLKRDIKEGSDLYGIAFDPAFSDNPSVYLCYIVKGSHPDGTRVSRFKVETSPDGWRFDPESEQIILTFQNGGHNGGCLKFGNDHCLYITTGDAAGATPPDPEHTGQDCSDLLSSVLRIDVHAKDADKPYAIPKDNPFLGRDNVRPEIWAYGFRNPWKMSFDRETGELWVGDVGWDLWELVFRVARGGNYGWSVTEGSQPIYPDDPRGPNETITAPIVQHAHSEARSLTGGYVYRGKLLPDLAGAYIYGDYETGKIWGVRANPDGSIGWLKELIDTNLKIITFGERADRELFVIDYRGECFLLEVNPDTDAQKAATAFPHTLSATGLFADVARHQPAEGVFAYEIASPMWHDGATAERLVAIPGDGQLSRNRWEFPEGTVLAKTLSLEGRRIETQILHRYLGEWRGYSYAWNEESTDASLVNASGDTKPITVSDRTAPDGQRSQSWKFASRTDCLSCHTSPSGYLLAVNPAQWNTPGQFERLALAGLFARPPRATAPFPNPRDPNVALEKRARAYLHMNCAHCHRSNGGGVTPIRFERNAARDAMQLATAPMRGDFGIPGAQVVKFGDPWHSVLLYRVSKHGSGRMPHLGSEVIDAHGVQLIEQWIGHDDAKPFDLPESPTQDEIREALADPSRAMAAAFAMRAFKLSPKAQRMLLAGAEAHPSAEIRDLFYAPTVNAIDPVQVLALMGDADRGARVLTTKGAVCLTCHQAAGQGRAVGPSLRGLGKKRSRAELLDSILNPSAAMEPEFAGYTAETEDGRIYVGILIEKKDDQLKLRDLSLREITIKTDELKQLTPMSMSLMPSGLAAVFTEQELADLIAFME
jgi:putative heme-binding domain-containing protein